MDVGLLLYKPGQTTPDHKHSNIDEVFYVVSGRGTITINGEVVEISSEDIIFSPCNEQHGFENTSDENLVVLQIKVTV